MAIRKKTASPAKGPEYKNEICDNCELATWVTHLHQHIDHGGEPICLTCPNKTYLIVRGCKACQYFVKRKEEKQ